jgi:hypothetical protein
LTLETDLELIAQKVSALGEQLSTVEDRLRDVEDVNARLERAAMTTARALEEVSTHWDAVYRAMRRAE